VINQELTMEGNTVTLKSAIISWRFGKEWSRS